MDDIYRVPTSACYILLNHQMIGDKSTAVQPPTRIQNIANPEEIVHTDTFISGSEQPTDRTVIKIECPSDEEPVISDVRSKKKKPKDNQNRDRAKRKRSTVSTKASEKKRIENSAKCPAGKVICNDLNNVPSEKRETRKVMETIRGGTNNDITSVNIAAVNPPDKDELDTTDPSETVMQVKKTTDAKEKKSRCRKKIETAKYECNHFDYKKGSHCGRTFAQQSAYKQHMLKHSTKKPHKCDQCEKTFMSKHELEDHRTLHLGEKSFICDMCGDAFLQRSDLIQHNRVVHDVQNSESVELRCDLCNKTFATKNSLQNHIGFHSQKFNCNMCSKSFAHSNALSVHKLTHTGQRPYACDLCDKSFTQRTPMMAHRRKHHGNHPPPPPTSLVKLEKQTDDPISDDLDDLPLEERESCNAMGMTSDDTDDNDDDVYDEYIATVDSQDTDEIESADSSDEVIRVTRATAVKEETTGVVKQIELLHYKGRERGIPSKRRRKSKKNKVASTACDICGRVLSSTNSLVRHMSSHNPTKSHLCDFCGKGLSSASHLKKHRRIHTGEKPYVCDICGKGFSVSDNMRVHRRVHTGEKPYKCHQCPKAFSQRSTLVIHERGHTGERPYVCKICNRGFSCQGNLTAHQKTICS